MSSPDPERSRIYVVAQRWPDLSLVFHGKRVESLGWVMESHVVRGLGESSRRLARLPPERELIATMSGYDLRQLVTDARSAFSEYADAQIASMLSEGIG